jgi:hypothetical protein
MLPSFRTSKTGSAQNPSPLQSIPLEAQCACSKHVFSCIHTPHSEEAPLRHKRTMLGLLAQSRVSLQKCYSGKLHPAGCELPSMERNRPEASPKVLLYGQCGHCVSRIACATSRCTLSSEFQRDQAHTIPTVCCKRESAGWTCVR